MKYFMNGYEVHRIEGRWKVVPNAEYHQTPVPVLHYVVKCFDKKTGEPKRIFLKPPKNGILSCAVEGYVLIHEEET